MEMEEGGGGVRGMPTAVESCVGQLCSNLTIQ